MAANIGQQMQQLYSQFGHLEGITIELHKELLAVRVDNQQATATVFLQGAQLTHYQRREEPAIIWCSEHCDYRQGASLRGGIPICWPWFGDITRNPDAVQQQLPHTDNSLPPHGLVRNRDWQLTTIECLDQHNTRLTFTLTLNTSDEPLWPYACELQLIVTIGAQLSVQFLVRNNSPTVINYSSALHSYFAISHIDNIAIEGLEQLPYIDCLDQWQQHTQTGALTITEEVDRIYRTGGQAIAINDSPQRTITITTSGSNSSIIWNPWREKSKRLSHFADNDYQQMVCVETANAAEDFVQLAPNQQHCLTLTISAD